MTRVLCFFCVAVAALIVAGFYAPATNLVSGYILSAGEVASISQPYPARQQPAESTSLGHDDDTAGSDSVNTEQFETQTSLIDQATCHAACREILDMIDMPFGILDSELEDALGNTELLADQLKLNPHLISQWISIATHSSGNKRSLVVATFSLLDVEHQRALGLALSDSNSRASRLAGIQLLASDVTMTQEHAQLFAERLPYEPDAYVRSAMLRGLGNPAFLANNSVTLSALEHAIQNDSDYSVRGEALLVAVNVLGHSQQTFDDTLNAIRSNVGVYQEFGAQALDALVSRQSLGEAQLDWRQQEALVYLRDDIMQPAFNHLPASARQIIDNL